MSDPKRLLDPEGDGTTEERGLVEAARGQGVPAAVKAAIWTAVAAQAAGVATSAAAAAGSAAKGGALAALWSWKGLAVLAVLGAGAATSVELLRPSSAPPAQVVPMAAPVAAPPAPATGESARPAALAPPSPEAVAEPAPPSVARPLDHSRPPRPNSLSGEATTRLPASRLAEEAQSLVEARRLLRAGALPAALAALAAANREFAGGRLGQEREALFIEALALAGQTDLARQRAAVFLRSYPGSPHTADVKRHAEGK